MSHIKKIMMAIAIVLGVSSAAKAASAIDALTVSITPNAFYAVSIDTTDVGLDLGTVALSASTQTMKPSTVTVESTYATTDIRLQGSIASAGTAWTFDTSSSTIEADAIATWAVFTDVVRSSQPTIGEGYFVGNAPGDANSHLVDSTNRYAGTSVADGNTDVFERNSSDWDFQQMDAIPPSPDAEATSLLWLYFRLPSASTSVDPQNITIRLTAVAPN